MANDMTGPNKQNPDSGIETMLMQLSDVTIWGPNKQNPDSGIETDGYWYIPI